ncbi:MAG: M48 family metalloprotease [Desulfosalsimonadaceae bacterium]|nr:M48 family metalloprotease [Desulfosalsimonadaceae bacterium]
MQRHTFNPFSCKFKKIISLGMCTAMLFCGLITPKTASSLSIKEEDELSKEFLKAVFQEFEVIKDPAIDNYINKVGHKIVAVMPEQPFPYKFYAVRQDAYNAFAGPGGHIFIFSGLFIALENEDELAALLAHEIAHVSCRHISDMIQKSKKTGMATMAGVVAGILVGLGGAGALGSALTVGSMAAGQSAALAYSREHEIQADQIGRTYLQKAGYSLTGLQSVLKKIRTVDWFGPDEIPTYLKTHPATEDRIMYLDNLLGNRPAVLPKKNEAFERAHTRITALYGNPDQAARIFKAQIDANPDNATAHYGYGLVMERNGSVKTAITHLTIAQKLQPDDPYLKTDLGQACFLAGDYQRALDLLTNAPHNTPDKYLYLGRTQMALGRYAEAADTFKQLIIDDPEHGEAYFLMGEAKGKMNELGSAHYYLGEHYLKKDDPKNARFHLTKALEYEKDPAQIDKIRKLLKELDESESFFGRRRPEKKKDGER